MRTLGETRRHLQALLATAAAVLLLSACGSGARRTTDSSSTAPRVPTTTITYVERLFPGSLDPAADNSSEGAQVNWLVYTGLLTYRHAGGVAGTNLIPGLAVALPKISDGGRTYTLTLRSGQVFSNGQPVVARDFLYAVERALRVPWAESGAFLTPVVKGAAAFADGRARTISGITVDDRSGRIIIRLTAPFGAFDEVLAEPALGLIPWRSRGLRADPGDPPPGDGPYMVRDILLGRSFSVVQNPRWRPIPGIPSGHVDVNVSTDPDEQADADAVLNNTADVLDWAGTLPPGLIAQIHAASAEARFSLMDLGGSTDYFFLNTRERPFDRLLAREAVIAGLDEDALDRIDSGGLEPGCYLLPPAIVGYVNDALSPCPYGKPGRGDLRRARGLLRRSGEEGAAVTVLSPGIGTPARWCAVYVRMLDDIGLRARLAPAQGFAGFGPGVARRPQTGFADWTEDFPDAVDFFGTLLDGDSIAGVDSTNLGEVDDPRINATVRRLGQLAAVDGSHAGTAWAALGRYVARRAYLAVFGYQKFPFLMSSRMDFAAAMENPIYGWDWTSFRLK